MINKDEAIKNLQLCLTECEIRLEKDQYNRPLQIVKEVVLSLLDYLQGKTEIPKGLEDNHKIGLLAIREFESHDEEFAEHIFKVADINNEIKNHINNSDRG